MSKCINGRLKPFRYSLLVYTEFMKKSLNSMTLRSVGRVGFYLTVKGSINTNYDFYRLGSINNLSFWNYRAGCLAGKASEIYR